MMRTPILLMLIAIAAPSPAKSADNWLALAKAGDHLAEHNLCKSYLYGENGRSKSGKRAFPWCVAAANAGISSSQTLLAEMYRFGTYVRQDDAKAKHYYGLAADQGHVHAQYMLGRMAILGEPPEPETACRWLKAAAAQDYDKAKELLEILDSTLNEIEGPGSKRFCETVESPIN